MGGNDNCGGVYRRSAIQIECRASAFSITAIPPYRRTSKAALTAERSKAYVTVARRLDGQGIRDSQIARNRIESGGSTNGIAAITGVCPVFETAKGAKAANAARGYIKVTDAGIAAVKIEFDLPANTIATRAGIFQAVRNIDRSNAEFAPRPAFADGRNGNLCRAKKAAQNVEAS